MKYIIILITFIALVSCDGRERSFKTNQTILKEQQLLDSFSKNTKYIPHTYTEIVTDTLLSNGFKVHIKRYSNMNKSNLYTYKKGIITYNEFYRELKSIITVTKNGNTLFNEGIDKSFLLNYNEDYKKLLKSYYLKDIWLEHYSTLQHNTITITLLLCQLGTTNCLTLEQEIDDKGNFKIH